MAGSILNVYNNGKKIAVYYNHGDHLGSASWKKERFGKPFASERAEEARSGILYIFITAVQHLQYLPYGERFVDQRTSGYNERFTFTGKERDVEKERSRGPFASERGDEPRSGIPYCSVYSYTYFGARYMDYELMTMWLSVDPLADKYPSISPYAYCAWNPMKLVDPDGREIGDYYTIGGRWLGSDGINDNKAYIASGRNTDGTFANAIELPIGNSELLDRATWVCGESGGSGEYITNRTQNVGEASKTSNATVADYYAAAINNMANDTRGGFYKAIRIRMSKQDKDGNIIYTSDGYFVGTGEGGNKNSKAFAEARMKGNEALNVDSRFTNSIAAVIHSLTEADPSGGCRAWIGGVKYAKKYVDNSANKKREAVFQFSFRSSGGFHSFYKNR